MEESHNYKITIKYEPTKERKQANRKSTSVQPDVGMPFAVAANPDSPVLRWL